MDGAAVSPSLSFIAANGYTEQETRLSLAGSRQVTKAYGKAMATLHAPFGNRDERQALWEHILDGRVAEGALRSLALLPGMKAGDDFHRA